MKKYIVIEEQYQSSYFPPPEKIKKRIISDIVSRTQLIEDFWCYSRRSYKEKTHKSRDWLSKNIIPNTRYTIHLEKTTILNSSHIVYYYLI